MPAHPRVFRGSSVRAVPAMSQNNTSVNVSSEQTKRSAANIQNARDMLEQQQQQLQKQVQAEMDCYMDRLQAEIDQLADEAEEMLDTASEKQVLQCGYKPAQKIMPAAESHTFEGRPVAVLPLLCEY